MNNSPKSLGDAALLELSRQGDNSAFKELVIRYAPRINSTLVHMLGTHIDSEEISQAVFVHFYQALNSQVDEKNLSLYLHRIAVNLSLDLLKSSQVYYQLSSQNESEEFHSQHDWISDSYIDETSNYNEIIQNAVFLLPPHLRVVAVLRLVQEFSIHETASILNIPIGVVLTRLSQAQARLRTILVPYIEV